MLVHARKSNLDELLKLVKKYHEYEGLPFSRSHIQATLLPLLKKESQQGRLWFIQEKDKNVGFVALCFGYSIEMGGTDAFIDEFFIEEKYRSKGLGTKVLKRVIKEAKALKIKALHLEANSKNKHVSHMYQKHGFTPRDKFELLSLAL